MRGKPKFLLANDRSLGSIPLVKSLPALLLAFCLLTSAATAAKSILLIAGPPSHAPGCHEHPAGCELLAHHLRSSGLDIEATVSLGWPKDPAMVAAADTIVIFSDGAAKHAGGGHLDALKARHHAGKGLAVLHWALGPADDEMKAFLMESIGGQFEPDWSVNPMWTMTAPTFAADHPACRGLTAFEAKDEWYFHIRLRDGITPLLQANPPEDCLAGKKDGKYSGNPTVRKALADKVPQTVAWAVENDTGSRGFGFTGGHFHSLWITDEFRQLVLNGIGWTAGIEIPESGIDGKLPEPAHESIDKAIAVGTADDVKLLLTLNPELAHQGESSRGPLDVALLRNKPEIVQILLAFGSDPDGAKDASRSPLHLAVNRKSPEMTAALLAAGAKPDRLDKGGWTPLHNAAAENQLETAKVLLDAGANPMTLSELGGTPLHEAATGGSAEIINLLLEHKIDPTIKSKQGVTALDLAKEYKNQAAIDILSKL